MRLIRKKVQERNHGKHGNLPRPKKKGKAMQNRKKRERIHPVRKEGHIATHR